MRPKRTSLQETLPPLVAAAMDALRPAPAPSGEVWEAHRQAFLAEARQYATQAVTPAPVLRRKSWKDLFAFNPKEVPMKAFVKVLLALALIFSATVGTVSASQQSLPGSVLYPVKLQYEDTRLSLTQAPEAKALLAMAYAEERVDEAVQLVERGDEVPEPLAARYQVQVGLALQTMEGLGEAQQLQLRAHFSGTLQNQVRVMEQVMARLHQGENEEHPDPTQAMLKTMLQAQHALGNTGHHGGGNETPGNVNAPGPDPNDNGNGQDNDGGNDGDNGSNTGEDKGKHHGGEDTGKPEDKGQNGDGGRPDNSGNPDNGNGGQGGNGGNDNGGSDNGGNGDGGSDNGGNGGQGDNGGGTSNGGKGGNGGGSGDGNGGGGN